ncbi:MAG: hypothetical protein JWR60_3508 [Polaromonas sp.]|nr:hypothetical protein [Polaromonas sp.]
MKGFGPYAPPLRGSLPPEGATLPAAWQSQFRGRYLKECASTLPAVRDSLEAAIPQLPDKHLLLKT